jgi:hypothetical protein
VTIAALLLTSTRQPYRRGGLAIGPRRAPTRVVAGAVLAPHDLLALLRDPLVAMAREIEEDSMVRVEAIDAETRSLLTADIEAALAEAEAALAMDDEEAAALVARLLAEDLNSGSAEGAEGKAGGEASPPVDPAGAADQEPLAEPAASGRQRKRSSAKSTQG